MSRNVLIFGATSAIAQAIGRVYAAAGASLVLVGRDRVRLESNAADLRVRGAVKVVVIAADLNEFAQHAGLVAHAAAELASLDVVLIAHGTLPDQRRCEEDTTELRRAVETNFVSVVTLATVVAAELERQGRGTLVVFGSVAGDRGKRSNYAYGAAKAGVAVFVEGLGIRLRSRGVGVLTVKPGFVDTPMTAKFRKGLIWATPERVAGSVCRAVEQGRSVIYVPWFWRPIMLLIRVLPSSIFSRMRL